MAGSRLRVVAPGRTEDELARLGALALPEVTAVIDSDESLPNHRPSALILDPVDRAGLAAALARGFDRYVEWTGPAGTADALRRAAAGLVISLTTRSAHRALTGAVLSRAVLERGIIAHGMVAGVGGAVQEAIANAVIHGNLGLSFGTDEFEDLGGFHRAVADRLAAPDAAQRRVTVDIDWTAADVTVAVSDEGQGFEAPAIDSADLDPAGFAPTGRGLILMRALASRVEFDSAGRRVRLAFTRCP